MELRKDPLTRSWVLTGDDPPKDDLPKGDLPKNDVSESLLRSSDACALCSGAGQKLQQISTRPAVRGGPWSARAAVHPRAIYHIEGASERRGEGMYDRMPTVGAHEILIENPRHDRQLWNSDDAEIEQYLLLVAQRIQDLKGDARLRYISIYKNFGQGSGQEFEHPHSELTATTFIPRRALYELRACYDYYKQKERCVFCDLIAQEMNDGARVVELRGDFLAGCPYATRVPYETWILPRAHDAAFEHYALSRPGAMRELASLLKRTLQRIRSITESFHLVVHTAPNTSHGSSSLGYWKTLADDYHWHMEILPIISGKAKSYTFKEVYYSPVSPETAARILREVPAEAGAA